MGGQQAYNWLKTTERILETAAKSERFCVFNSTDKPTDFHNINSLIVGWDALDNLTMNSALGIAAIEEFVERNQNKWIFGHINYEMGYMLEPYFSGVSNPLEGFSPASLFVPRFVAECSESGFNVVDQLNNTMLPSTHFDAEAHLMEDETAYRVHFAGTPDKAAYLDTINRLKEHLQRGDIYEINYCLPFRASGELANPLSTWMKMQEQERAPHAAFYREGKNWLLCSSPERFLSKTGHTLRSEPIKGTAPRGRTAEEDQQNKTKLYQSEKERAENVMIVDLVRNDMGKIAETGTVCVDELFGIKSYPGVHQMVSSISCTLKPYTGFTDILRALFPMGSMTGAPKISAMELIHRYEQFSRNLYSGSVGVIKPNGDFDFNVVIRSILYNEENSSMLFPAGSAITAQCDPETEYDECLLKIRGMLNVLGLNADMLQR